MEKKHLCQQAGQTGEKCLKGRTKWEEEDDQQLCEEVEDWVGKQNVWGHINSRDLVINKTGLMEDHSKHIHINKEVPTRQNDGDHFHTVSEKLAQLGTSLKCLYTSVHSTENKQGIRALHAVAES